MTYEVQREAVVLTILRERAHLDAELCEWLDEAEAEGAAIVDRAHASVRSLHDDVRRLREQLLGVVEQATTLLPALEAADRSLAERPPEEAPALPEAAVEVVPAVVVAPPPRSGRLARLLRRG